MASDECVIVLGHQGATCVLVVDSYLVLPKFTNVRNLDRAVQFLGDADTVDARRLRDLIRRTQGIIDFQPTANPFSELLKRIDPDDRSLVHVAEAAESRYQLAGGAT